MSRDMGVADDRTDALLKDQVISGEEKRAASVRLAGLALTAADGDRQAAKAMLREALEAIGAVEYDAPQPRTMRMRTDMSYRRPGQ